VQGERNILPGSITLDTEENHVTFNEKQEPAVNDNFCTISCNIENGKKDESGHVTAETDILASIVLKRQKISTRLILHTAARSC